MSDNIIDLAKSVAEHPSGCRCQACDAYRAHQVAQRSRVEVLQDARNTVAAERSVPLERREVEAAEAAHAVATIEAQSFGRIASKLEGEVSRQDRGADRRASVPGKLSGEDETAFLGATQRGPELRKRAEHYRKEQRKAEKRARIAIREILPYPDLRAPSMLSDVYAYHAQLTGTENMFTSRVQSGVQERMAQFDRWFADQADRNTSLYQTAEAMYLDGFRGPDVKQNRRNRAKARADFRALTTGGGATASASGGGTAAFAWVAFMLDQFAPFRSPCPVVASQLNHSVALPDVGLNVYIPSITATTSVTETVEGSAVAEADPTVTYAGNSTVENFSGRLTISQAVLDRTGPNMSADVFIFQQLRAQLDAEIDLFAINAILSGAETVTDSGSFLPVGTSGLGTNSFAKDVAAGKKLLTDTAGTRIRARMLFAISDLLDTVSSWGDAEGRPLLPWSYDPDHGQGVDDGDGYVCQMFGLQAYADDNIPVSGSDTQVIITDPKFTLLMEGTPRMRGFPSYGASSLDPVLVLDQYACCIPRYPSGAAILSGSAYATSNFS